MNNIWKMSPYTNTLAEAYVTAINILAVEYLVKTNNEEEYGKWADVVSRLSDDELNILEVSLSFNAHTSSLGAMITQGDYESQRETLMEFLEYVAERLK